MPTTALGSPIQTEPAQPLPATAVSVQNSATADANSRNKVDHQAKTEKVPRPPNAFILYRKHYHTLTKAAHPEYHNNDICKAL